ncbi:GTP-binding protein [Paenibacillus sp. YYML68]|uniref:CobW family GTP-binding protein n=1 Tax=Paenibacillus sp. YYML68 TaxID=2909250 RepID=UPI00248F6C2B|nr:GTP-binding protein [Paenibacillus sp. YYML68]
MKQAVPVHILSGFLGSGKTTLLTQAIDYYRESGRKPAVLMNELGEVNLDGTLVDATVPMTELLGGCICCTIRGDLGMELKQLVDEHQPDVILVESTGAANPLEMLDGVTDASLLTEVKLASVITVVDAQQLAEKSVNRKGKTYRLMADQIRCATLLLLNKTDLVPPSEWVQLETLIRELNPAAPIIRTVRSVIEMSVLERLEGGVEERHRQASYDSAIATPIEREVVARDAAHEHTAPGSCTHEGHAQAAHEHTAPGSCNHEDHAPDSCPTAAQHHHSHRHVMVHTHYFKKPIDSEKFEALVAELPDDIFRAKGVLRFTDTTSPFWFQYAYKQADYMKIAPKQDVPSVAVFIGEHFDPSQLMAKLNALEEENATSSA